jgi:hypothetical protein
MAMEAKRIRNLCGEEKTSCLTKEGLITTMARSEEILDELFFYLTFFRSITRNFYLVTCAALLLVVPKKCAYAYHG